MSFFDWIFRKRPVTPVPVVKPKPPVGGQAGPTAPKVVPTRSGVAVAGTVAAALVIAIPFVADFEGFYPRVYRDPVGVKTICYGQTGSDGADFSKVYTKQECLDMLGKDLERYNKYVDACIHVPLPTHRRAALISFVYNLGQGNLCNGPVARNLNAGNVTAGCNAILAYNHAGGAVLPGLTRRRQAERALCLRTD